LNIREHTTVITVITVITVNLTNSPRYEMLISL
jgi:hypothetical protein